MTVRVASVAVSNIPTGNRVRLRSSGNNAATLRRRLENIERSAQLLAGSTGLGLGENVDIYV